MTNPQAHNVEQAINDSISTDSVPVLTERLDTQEWVNTVNAIADLCDDWVELSNPDDTPEGVANVRHYWGTDVDGDDWRVHVHGTQ